MPELDTLLYSGHPIHTSPLFKKVSAASPVKITLENSRGDARKPFVLMGALRRWKKTTIVSSKIGPDNILSMPLDGKMVSGTILID